MNLRIGNYQLAKTEWEDRDSRGILWVWEEPRTNANYVIGCDPTIGITGWDRTLRVQDDEKTDNAVIQVIRKGKTNEPDVQVAEFAAPCDPYELAPILNFIGRMYPGQQEDGQALTCIEVYPGPGLWTQNELVNRFGYINLPPWRYEDGIMPKITKKFGWFSTRSTRRDLWIRGIRHITSGGIIINSPWLVEEMVKCVQDNFLTLSSRAQWGAHDDRVVSLLIGIWYAHEWSLELSPPEADKPVLEGGPSWQASDISLADMSANWDSMFDSMVGDGE